MSDETSTGSVLPTPKGLGIDGKRLWKAVTTAYFLRVDEVFLLENACRMADTIANLDAAMVDQPLIVTGSMGQQREHPLLSEVRQQRAAVARLLKQIDLPEVDTLVGAARAGERSAHMRQVAGARWARRG